MKTLYSPSYRQSARLRAAIEPLELRRLLHAGHSGIFINAGGAAYADSGGHTWLADTFATGGQVKTASYDVTGTIDDAIYASRRFGAAFNYSIPVASTGTYHVTVMFSEPWFTAQNQRVFEVSAEGSAKLSRFDLLAVSAPKAAASRSFDLTVTDGRLDLEFRGVVENAMVSGISVEKIIQTPAAPVSLTASAESDSQIRLSWVDASSDETGFLIERSHDGATFTQIALVGADTTTYLNTGLPAGVKYSYRVRATNSAGASAASEPASAKTLSSSQSPFSGTPIRLPGTIQAEDFDHGGASVAFSDATADNAGGMYRDTPVDIYSVAPPAAVLNQSPGPLPQYGVGSIRAGEWMEYTVELAQPADYAMQLRFASGSSGGTASIQLDGAPMVEGVSLPNTGGWSRFDLIAIPAQAIPAGRHVIRISFDRATRGREEIGLLDWIRFTASGVSTPLPAAPVNLAARGVGDTQIHLSWDDVASNETSYSVQRRSGSAEFLTIATLPAGAQWYVDTSVSAETLYGYRVIAENASGAGRSAEVAVGSWVADSFRWKRAAGNPAARYEAAGAAVNGKLYTLGGYINEQIEATARVDAYDPARNSWEQLGDMPEVVTHAGQAVDGNVIYIAGGFLGNHPGLGTRSVWRYDTVHDRWDRMPPLPQPRGAGALARVGTELHFFGGLNRAQHATINQRQHWVLDLTHTALGWNSRAALPNARNHLAAVELGGKIYAIGGQDLWNELSGAKSDVDVFDPMTNTWSAAAPLPIPRSHISASTFSLDGRIFVVGGATNDFATMRDVTVYNPDSNSWSAFRQLTGPRLSPVAGAIGKMLIVATGSAYGLQAQGETFFGLLD